MNRHKLITVAALAALALACSESVGGMLEDAGQMLMDAGDAMTPDAGAQDTPVQCNKSESYQSGETTITQHWAEFPVTPGQTEVTICNLGDPNATTLLGKRDGCYRVNAGWNDGTSTGVVNCGLETDATGWIGKPKSITVHN